MKTTSWILIGIAAVIAYFWLDGSSNTQTNAGVSGSLSVGDLSASLGAGINPVVLSNTISAPHLAPVITGVSAPVNPVVNNQVANQRLIRR